jgi:hypothetical protein
LPAVASTIRPPGFNFPSRSAASTIARPMRSLIEPPGFWFSNFRNSLHGPVSNRVTAISGVLPISPRTAGGCNGFFMVVSTAC